MRKLFIIIVSVFILTGCNKQKSAVDEVKDYLNEYTSLSSSVKKSLNNVILNRKEFNEENKKMYKKIFLKQYKDLNYTILNEEYDGNKALITVNVSVYDLNKAEERAVDYLSKNLHEFYNEKNVFDNAKYIDYKLKLMYEIEDRINYNIVFFLNYKNKKWVLEQPTEDDLEKIHGIYIEQ